MQGFYSLCLKGASVITSKVAVAYCTVHYCDYSTVQNGVGKKYPSTLKYTKAWCHMKSFDLLCLQGASVIQSKVAVGYCTVHKCDYYTVYYDIGANEPPQSKYTIALGHMQSFDSLGLQGASVITSKVAVAYCTVLCCDYCTVQNGVGENYPPRLNYTKAWCHMKRFDSLCLQWASVIQSKVAVGYCTVHQCDYYTVQYGIGVNDPPQSKYTIALCHMQSFDLLGLHWAVAYCTIHYCDYCTVQNGVGENDPLC